MLPAALFLALQAVERPFTPALDYREHSVAEWVQKLDDHDNQADRAAWSLYYYDDRSPEVVDALRAQLRRPHAYGGDVEIDTVLAHWGVDFAPVPRFRFLDYPSDDVPPAEYRPPVDPLPEPSDVLRARLAAADELAIPAALTLLVRNEFAAEALDRLASACAVDVPPRQARIAWLTDYARRGFGAALGREIRRRVRAGEADSAAVGFLVARLTTRPSCVPTAAEGLAELALAGGAHATLAKSLLLGATPVWIPSDGLSDSQFHQRQYACDDAPLQAGLALYYGRRVEACADAGSIDLTLLAEIGARIERFPAIVPAVVPGLLRLFEASHDASLQILRVLGHCRCDDPRVRTAWLRFAREWTDFSAAGLERFPCLSQHDGETTAALFDVLRRAETPSALGEALAWGGLVDADAQPIVRWYLDHLGDQPWAWFDAVELGFLGTVEVPPDEGSSSRRPVDPALRMARLQLNWNTRRARHEQTAGEERAIADLIRNSRPPDSEGFSLPDVASGIRFAHQNGLRSPEMVDAVFQFFRRFGDWCSTYDVDEAVAYLDAAPRDAARDREIRRIAGRISWLGDWITGRPWSPDREITADGRVVIESVPRLRKALYTGQPNALEELVLTTRCTDRDLDYLIPMLEHGPADTRLRGLRIVELGCLDAPRVREAVRRLVHDVDDEVARHAVALAVRRGW